MSAVLGSDFGSRLNMNLREDKHWSYGAFSFIRDARGPRPFLTFAPVQTDKTREAIVELQKELNGIVGDRPIQPDELERAKASLTLTLPGSWETMGAVAGTIGEIVAFGLDDRYFDTYADRVRAQTIATVTEAATRTVRPDQLIWVIVGDRAKIEPAVRELGLGEIHFVDADGNAVPTPTLSDPAVRVSCLLASAATRRQSPGHPQPRRPNALPLGRRTHGLCLLVTRAGALGAQYRRGNPSFFHGPLSVGPRAGRDFENHAWSLGGQVSLPVGRNLELRPSGDFFFPKDGDTGWQLNGDAAFHIGENGPVYAGGGIAFATREAARRRPGYNLFAGLNAAPSQRPHQPFLEARWTFVNDTSPFRLALGFNYSV